MQSQLTLYAVIQVGIHTYLVLILMYCMRKVCIELIDIPNTNTYVCVAYLPTSIDGLVWKYRATQMPITYICTNRMMPYIC
jgi:hypothetical protein